MNKDDILAYLRERYTYDAETGAIRHKGRDRAVKGVVHVCGYRRINIRVGKNYTRILMHRAAWALYYGRWPSEIDHINGDKTDNRLENLREVSASENDANRVWAWKPNARTGLPGVSDAKSGFQISSSGQRLYFSDKYEAFFHLILLGRMFKES